MLIASDVANNSTSAAMNRPLATKHYLQNRIVCARMAVPQRSTNVSTSDRVVQCIYDVLDEFNAELPLGLKLAKSADSVLYGENGQLDSINLVHLIVAVEERVESEFGVAVTLADERAMSMRNSPFATVASLSEYVSSLLETEATASQ